MAPAGDAVTSEFTRDEVGRRLDQAIDLILRLSGGDLTARGELSKDGDEFDAVIGGLNMLAEELELTFAESTRRTAELETANAELEAAQAQLIQSAKLASLGEIAAGIAHELNQPLGIIQLYGESAIGGLADLEAVGVDSVSEQISVALGQVERASEIIEHVRTFARNDAEGSSMNTDIEELVAASLVLLRSELGERDITLVETIEPGLAKVHCRGSRIQQVLFNLVGNARDAVDGRPDATIELEVVADESSVVFEVRDNGPGISDADREHIMDPFFTTKPAGRGTGLGLPICLSIAADHGGSLEYERRDGWTVFRLSLPENGAAR